VPEPENAERALFYVCVGEKSGADLMPYGRSSEMAADSRQKSIKIQCILELTENV